MLICSIHLLFHYIGYSEITHNLSFFRQTMHLLSFGNSAHTSFDHFTMYKFRYKTPFTWILVSIKQTVSMYNNWVLQSFISHMIILTHSSSERTALLCKLHDTRSASLSLDGNDTFHGAVQQRLIPNVSPKTNAIMPLRRLRHAHTCSLKHL